MTPMAGSARNIFLILGQISWSSWRQQRDMQATWRSKAQIFLAPQKMITRGLKLGKARRHGNIGGSLSSSGANQRRKSAQGKTHPHRFQQPLHMVLSLLSIAVQYQGPSPAASIEGVQVIILQVGDPLQDPLALVGGSPLPRTGTSKHLTCVWTSLINPTIRRISVLFTLSLDYLTMCFCQSRMIVVAQSLLIVH